MSHDPESFFYGDADIEMAELEAEGRRRYRLAKRHAKGLIATAERYHAGEITTAEMHTLNASEWTGAEREMVRDVVLAILRTTFTGYFSGINRTGKP